MTDVECQRCGRSLHVPTCKGDKTVLCPCGWTTEILDCTQADEKSGRFVVRIPKSLHAALEAEAKNEGVSLNQLVLSMLSVSLGSRLSECEHRPPSIVDTKFLGLEY